MVFFEIPEDFAAIHQQLREFYWAEQDNPLFALKPPDSPGLFVNWRGWKFVEQNYPLIEQYRVQYDLAHLLIFFSMDGRWWDDHPHSHNTKTGGSILFPIHRTSTAVLTQFYEVLEPELVNNPNDSSKYGYLEYTGKTRCIGEFHLLDRPYGIDVNVFHKPVLVSDPEEVNGRVICNWKAKGELSDLASRFWGS